MEPNLYTPYDKEYMKMTILKHEETFRQQVYELHRLYQIQKKLMQEIVVNNSAQNASKNAEKREGLDESSIELTLGPSSSFQERKISNENAVNSDSAPTFSSSSSGSSHIMKTTSRNFSHNEGLKHNWGFESGPSFVIGRRNRDDADEDEFRQDHKLKQSPWLFQALSLNMT